MPARKCQRTEFDSPPLGYRAQWPTVPAVSAPESRTPIPPMERTDGRGRPWRAVNWEFREAKRLAMPRFPGLDQPGADHDPKLLACRPRRHRSLENAFHEDSGPELSNPRS